MQNLYLWWRQSLCTSDSLKSGLGTPWVRVYLDFHTGRERDMESWITENLPGATVGFYVALHIKLFLSCLPLPWYIILSSFLLFFPRFSLLAVWRVHMFRPYLVWLRGPLVIDLDSVFPLLSRSTFICLEFILCK